MTSFIQYTCQKEFVCGGGRGGWGCWTRAISFLRCRLRMSMRHEIAPCAEMYILRKIMKQRGFVLLHLESGGNLTSEATRSRSVVPVLRWRVHQKMNCKTKQKKRVVVQFDASRIWRCWIGERSRYQFGIWASERARSDRWSTRFRTTKCLTESSCPGTPSREEKRRERASESWD